jgi:NADH dehydrogenase FAD-containing subunit
VLGARFGGLAVSTWLRRLFSPDALAVTVVDQWQTMVYRPGLVKAMVLDPYRVVRRVCIPLAHYGRRQRVEFIHDRIVGIDPDRCRVYTATHAALRYDVLFIATGTTPLWDQIPGLRAHLGGVCEGYLARHSGLTLQAVEQGQVVFAAGPINGLDAWDPPIQVACECPLLESALIFDYAMRKRRRRDRVTITVVTPGLDLGQPAGPRARQQVAELLAERGIRTVRNARVTLVTDRALYLGDQPLAYDHAVWLPPLSGAVWLQPPLVDDHGWIPTSAHMQHPRYDNIYAVGDVVSHSWPKMAHAAMVQARIAVQHWSSRINRHQPPAPYQPLMLWFLQTGGPHAFFSVSNAYYGGNRDFVQRGFWADWAKNFLEWAYVHTHGSLPVMP